MLGELIQGDCLDVMAGMDEGSVDLIYLDPPYCTGKDWGAFDDRWEWDEYLAFMEERLRACHRVLAQTGSLYLHVDPNTSHYLKVMLDGIFGRKHFRNEIVWCYRASNPSLIRHFPRKHDSILFYARGCENIYHQQFMAYSDESITSQYRHQDGDGRRYRKHSRKSNGELRKYYLDEMQGIPVQSWWSDICCFGTATQSKERNGYPTQKPLALLDRIIRASSNEGDLVLDPFCGSATTCEAAQRLDRRWIGIDVGDEAIRVATDRMNRVPVSLFAEQNGALYI